jgi:hypothetical protein
MEIMLTVMSICKRKTKTLTPCMQTDDFHIRTSFSINTL